MLLKYKSAANPENNGNLQINFLSLPQNAH